MLRPTVGLQFLVIIIFYFYNPTVKKKEKKSVISLLPVLLFMPESVFTDIAIQ